MPTLLRRAVAFVDDNAHRHITLADIAASVHLTPRALQYMFRRHMDLTPTEYLRQVRMSHVHRDLLAADSTVKMQPVQTAGEADDTHMLIGKGLAAGDRVVTEGQFRLKPGARVTPLAPGEVPKAPTAEEIRKAAEPGQTRGRGGRH